MTRSARKRAHLANLAPSTLSPDRQKAVKKYRHALTSNRLVKSANRFNSIIRSS